VLTACQWLFAHDTRSVTVTATCRVDQLTTFGEKSPPSSAVSGSPRKVRDVPLPRTDAYLQSIGEHVEDVSRIAATRPFRTHGPAVTRDALAFLAADSRRDRHRHPRARLRTESGRGSTPLTFDAYIDAGRALVVANPSPAGFEEAPHGDDILTAATTVHLDLCDVTHVPLAMAGWVGLAPAWSLDTTPELIAEELILRRADDPAVAPPEDADNNLRYMWSQPWFLWTLQASGVDHGRVMVNAGRAGHFALTQGGGERVRFGAMMSYSVWLDLVAMVERSVTAA
jgi:hypothetical protein